MTDEQVTPHEEQAQEPMPEMRAEDALRFAIGIFNDLAWIELGIRQNPATGEAKTDLVQAKLAIDALNALIPLTEGKYAPNEVRDLKNLLSSLQLNYVQRTNTQG